MNQYIITLFVAGIIFSLIRYLAASYPAFKPYVSFLIGLVTVLITVSPLIPLVKDFSKSDSVFPQETVSPEYEGSEKTLLALAEDSLCRTVTKTIRESYNNRVYDISITLDYDSEKEIFLIQRMKVVLENETGYEDIKAYLTETYSRDAVVTIMEGSV